MTRHAARRAALAALFGALLGAAPLWAQSIPADEEQAKARFLEAETHYKLQEFEQALLGYKEAYRLSQRPALLFNIGQCLRRLDRYEEALRAYRSYLRDAPEGSRRQEAEELIRDLESLAARPDAVVPAPPGESAAPPEERRGRSLERLG